MFEHHNDRFEPLDWALIAFGVCVLMLILRVVLWAYEPGGISHLGKRCDVRPYVDPRCVTVKDVEVRR